MLKHLTTRVICGKPLAPVTTTAGPLCQPLEPVNNTNVYPCNRVGLVVSWGALCFDTGGRGLLVLIIVVPSCAPKRVKLAKKEVKKSGFNSCTTI